MRHVEAIALGLVLSLSGPDVAFGRATPPEEPAITGIAEVLPPLTARERETLIARASAGDRNAMYALARHALMSCDGSPPPMCGAMYYWWKWNDPREAERWWEKAAAHGDPKAMILLGHLYAEPWGVKQDLAKAASWFKKAAAMNRMEAIRDLYELYMGAWSDARDEELANLWLRRAAARGDMGAMLLLGLRYDAGWGVRADAAKAAAWYQKVIDRKRTGEDVADFRSTQSVALNNLGALYEEGRGVPRDESKAAQLYRRAASQTLDPYRALYNLAALCESGRGVTPNKAAAIQFYRIAALDLPQARADLKRLGVEPLDLGDLPIGAQIKVTNRLLRKGTNACDLE